MSSDGAISWAARLLLLGALAVAGQVRAQAPAPTEAAAAAGAVATTDQPTLEQQRAWQRHELLQLEIEQLRRERPRVGFPIVLTSVGLATMSSALLMLGVAAAFEAGSADPTSARERASFRLPFLITAGVGALVAGAGAFWTVRRFKQRRRYNQRMRALMEGRF